MNYKDKIRLTLAISKNEPTEHGTDNEGREYKTGYCQAVSGLCEMTPEYDAMFTAEARYWRKFKQGNPELWGAQLNRLKRTRGVIFTERLLKCFKWLNRNDNR